MQSRNLAARAGRWSAQHHRTAILGRLLCVVLATVVGGQVGQNDLDESAAGNGESKHGDMMVEAAGFPDQAGEQVLVPAKGSAGADDPQVPHGGAFGQQARAPGIAQSMGSRRRLLRYPPFHRDGGLQ